MTQAEIALHNWLIVNVGSKEAEECWALVADLIRAGGYQKLQKTNYKDVVAVAIAFAANNVADGELHAGIWTALRGMSNPDAILKEIKRQRGGHDV